jgi:TIR domain
MAGPGAINKPTVFISHAATDEPIAEVLSGEIKRIFADGVEVFASSVPGVIKPGAEWLKDIQRSLGVATAVIVIVSPTSINRPWVWFEVGASWSRMEEGEGRIIPVCVPEIEKGALPEPLGRLHAMSLGKAAETKEVFRALTEQFGFGTLKGFKYAAIKARLPKYDELSVADADLRSGTLYTGPYEGYSGEELALVVDDRIVKPNWDFDIQRPRFDDRIFGEQLLHFRRLDEDFHLPPKTAKRYLAEVVTSGYPARISHETENTIRFTLVAWEDYQVWRAERGEF